MVTTTTVYSFQKPDVSGDEDAWGGYLNANIDKYESILTGNTTITSLVITTADINGGTLDNVVIGGSTAAAVTGTTITGTSFVSSGNMTFGDSNKAIFGAGSDLQIYHDGTDSYISDQGTGRIKILGDNETYIANAANGEYKARFITDGAVELYYDAAKKFETTSTGVDVTGTVTADGLTVETSGDPSALIRNTSTGTVSLTLRRSANDDAYTDWTFDNTGGNLSIISDDTTRPNATRIKMTYDGDISFYEDTGTSAKLFWDASAENLGIRTASPVTPLHVSGGSATRADIQITTSATGEGAGDGFQIGYIDSLGAFNWNYENSDWYVGTNNNRRLTINGSGQVGIGTSSPERPLHISASPPIILLEDTGGGTNDKRAQIHVDTGVFQIKARNDDNSGRTDILTADLGTGYVGVGTTAPIYAADIKTSGTNNGQLRVGGASTSATGLLLEQTNSGTTTANIQNSYYATSASASLSIKSGYTTFHTGTSGSERMRIDSSGRLLLNTTVEGYTDYADDFTISNTSGRSGMTIRSGNTSQGSIFFSDSNSNTGAGAYAGYVTYIHSSDSLQLGTSGAERMRIDASGQVGIGISSIPSGAQLYVDTGVNSHAAVFRCDTGGYACAIFDNQASSGTRNFTSFRIDNSIVGSITSTGSTTAYNTSSDHRLKENVVELTGATARLKQLEPKRFNFIADADTTVDGFLAHEVQSVVPEAITGTHNEVDADGNPVYQGIDQSKLVPLLVATIKELEARITALEGE